jgi:hypothetical protein
VAALVFETRSARAAFVAAGLGADLGGLSQRLRGCLHSPLPDLELSLPPSEVSSTSPAHPLLSFAEIAIPLGQRCLAVCELALRLLLQRRPGLAGGVAQHRGQLVIDECCYSAAHRDPGGVAVALLRRPLRWRHRNPHHLKVLIPVEASQQLPVEPRQNAAVHHDHPCLHVDMGNCVAGACGVGGCRCAGAQVVDRIFHGCPVFIRVLLVRGRHRCDSSSERSSSRSQRRSYSQLLAPSRPRLLRSSPPLRSMSHGTDRTPFQESS